MEYRRCWPEIELLAYRDGHKTVFQQQSSVSGLSRLTPRLTAEGDATATVKELQERPTGTACVPHEKIPNFVRRNLFSKENQQA